MIVPPSTLSPLIWSFARLSVPPETSSVLPEPTVISLVAIVAPSIFPPLISVVIKTELGIVITPVESAIVADAVPSFALMFETSIFVVSIVVEFKLVIFPVIEPRVLIVVSLMVPPSILSPLIWSSERVSVPWETSRVLSFATVISLVAIVTPSIVPPLISVVVNIELGMFITPVESVIVAEELPSFALMFETSMFVVSTFVELTVVISPVVEVSVLIVIALIVPPSTLSPLIWSFARVSVPPETSRVLPVPTVISLVAIVIPSIVPLLISGFDIILFDSVWEPDIVTTVSSIVNVFPSLFIPVPAVICPAPENCENSIEFVPMFILSEVTTNPESAFVLPLSTKEKDPEVTFILELKSLDLSQEPLVL